MKLNSILETLGGQSTMVVLGKFAMAVSLLLGMLSFSAQGGYRYENSFDVMDEAGRAYGIEVAAPASYSHGFGAVEDGAYRILIPGAKHFLETPKLANFRLETDLEITRHRQEFHLGVKVLYRWNRNADTGHEFMGQPFAFDIPAAYRVTVSSPGIGRMKIAGDAPFEVLASTPDSVCLRTETQPDTGNFFTFRAEP